MTAKRRWIILSPHLDDGALSVGGLARSLSRTQKVEIWTLFTHAPLRGPYSPTALWLHSVSGGLSGYRLARKRRAEDRAACEVLHVKYAHFGWSECAYRKRANGKFLYRDCIQSRLPAEDLILAARIARSIEAKLSTTDIILAPMGIGGHADHLVTLQAALKLSKGTLLFYPELPYASRRPERLAELSDGMGRIGYRLENEQVDAWVAAVECFSSQLAMFEDESGTIVDQLQSYAMPGTLGLFASESVDIAELPLDSIFSPPQPPAFGKPKVIQRLTPPHQQAGSDLDFPAWSSAPLAPIAVFAFDRLALLKKTLRSLEKCDGFAESQVHLFCDGPKPGVSDISKVHNLRQWARSWSLKHGAHIHEVASNQGLHDSIVSGVSAVLEKNETVIVLEDDLIVSKAFLVFMNQALQAYSDRDDIMQISGYSLPHRTRLEPVGLLRIPGSWGWATWRRAWANYTDDVKSQVELVRAKGVHSFDMNNSYGYFDALERNASGDLKTWAVRWYASIFLRNGLVVYPAQSFTRNIGFGPEATNCKPGPTDKVFARQRINGRTISPNWQSIGYAETSSYAEVMESFYRWQSRQWVKAPFIERVRGSLARIGSRGTTA